MFIRPVSPSESVPVTLARERHGSPRQAGSVPPGGVFSPPRLAGAQGRAYSPCLDRLVLTLRSVLQGLGFSAAGGRETPASSLPRRDPVFSQRPWAQDARPSSWRGCGLGRGAGEGSPRGLPAVRCACSLLWPLTLAGWGGRLEGVMPTLSKTLLFLFFSIF